MLRSSRHTGLFQFQNDVKVEYRPNADEGDWKQIAQSNYTYAPIERFPKDERKSDSLVGMRAIDQPAEANAADGEPGGDQMARGAGKTGRN